MINNEKLALKKECKKFILRDESLFKIFNASTEKDQELVLNYLSTEKGTIPYKMITRYDFLDISPEQDNFFLLHHFYSSVKDTIITKEEYENVKRFYQTLKLKDLAKLNKIIIFKTLLSFARYLNSALVIYKISLKLILENVILHRKCNSTSSFSGYVHRDKIKCLIALPTKLNMSEFLRKH